MDWKPIDKLEPDGRQVLFWAPAGPFLAPAKLGYASVTEKTVIYRDTGEWPNVDFNPTHFAEIVSPEAAAR